MCLRYCGNETANSSMCGISKKCLLCRYFIHLFYHYTSFQKISDISLQNTYVAMSFFLLCLISQSWPTVGRVSTIKGFHNVLYIEFLLYFNDLKESFLPNFGLK